MYGGVQSSCGKKTGKLEVSMKNREEGFGGTTKISDQIPQMHEVILKDTL